MIEIKSDKRTAWLDEDGSKLVLIMGHGTNERYALDNLSDRLHGLAQEVAEAARSVEAPEEQR